MNNLTKRKDENRCVGCGSLLKGGNGRPSKSGCCHNCVERIKSNYNRLNAKKIYNLIREAEISALKKGISACEEILNSQQISGKNTYTTPIVPLKNSEPLEIGCDGELPSADTLRGLEDGE